MSREANGLGKVRTERGLKTMDVALAITIVIMCGAAGGFVNVFIGDSGLHLPRVENDIFQPGFLAAVIVGALAALGSWGASKSIALFGADAQVLKFTTGDIANALIIGFGGVKWFKSETEKDVLQKTAAVAAAKSPDPAAATRIAAGTPYQALKTAMEMHQ